MAILASLRGLDIFSSLPSTPHNDNQRRLRYRSTSPPPRSPPKPPIPIPKYPPSLKSQRRQVPKNPAFKIPHSRTNYYRSVKEGVIPADGDRSVVIGESGVSYRLPGAPFEFQFSYSETPKAKPLALREPAFLPFAPPTMPRPWTGKAPLKSAKDKKRNRKIPLSEPYNAPSEEEEEEEGVKRMEMPRPFPYGRYPLPGRTREDILGEPLQKWEISAMVKPRVKDNRMVNLGRDGLTHNMLELIHSHWRRFEICKIRCKGVPTVDMRNVCYHIEDKTGGKIVYRAGGSVYLYRGRNYNYATRPQYPVMLWRPATPVYPKLIQEAPEGLTKDEADEMRLKGEKLLPICKLAKNGVYITLVKDVRDAFLSSPMVKIDCTGLHASDYKKIGAKLKELVPCVLLSFDDEQILMWRGSEWKSTDTLIQIPEDNVEKDLDNSDEISTSRTSSRMLSLWQRAIDSNKAMVLEETNLGPDELLKKVEEFESVSQVTDHSYEAQLSQVKDGENRLTEEFEEVYPSNSSDEADSLSNYDKGDFADDFDEGGDDLFYDSDSSVPMGSLPIDIIAKKNYGRKRI